MDVEVFVLCKFADEENGKIIIDKPFNILEVLQLPCTHTFTAFVRSRINNDEQGTHTTQITILDPDGKELTSAGGLLVTPKNHDNPFSSDTCIFNLSHIPFSNYGIHKAVLRIDSVIRKEIPFVVTTFDRLPENHSVLNN